MSKFLLALNARDRGLGVTYRIPTVAEVLWPSVGFRGGIEEFRAAEEYKKFLAWCWDIDNGDTWTFPWSARTENGGLPTVNPDGFESLLGKSWEAASEVVSMFRNITDGYVESEGLFLCNGDSRTSPETLAKGYPILRATYQPDIDTICFRLCAEVQRKTTSF